MRRRILVAMAVVAAVLTGCGDVAVTGEGQEARGETSPSTTSEFAGRPTTTAGEPTATTSPRRDAETALAARDEVTVGSITDGDTFRTSSGERIRIIGVDTPERGDCYFGEATDHLAGLIGPGTPIRLVYDVERTDRYGRTLAYVYRSDDGLFVNRAMAADGYALQMTIAPNVAHAEEFRAAVAEARSDNRGLWSGCSTGDAPATPSTPALAPPPPPPAPAPPAASQSGGNCHQSYEGTCIPPGVSDADCAGGSGNGPHYVQEKNIRVVGSDEFDLDSDSDGLGCES